MRIFAVEDEPTILKNLAKHIREVLPDAEIFAFQDAEDAVAALTQGAVDIAFLDIELGDMNGVELAKRIKADCPLCNIVFCTGYSSYATQAFDLGASDYLMKPITNKKLEHALTQLRHARKPVMPKGQLYIRCFGQFEVFYNGEPLLSLTKRAKELFAYLVDQAGAVSSAADIISTLFPNNAESYFRVAKRDLERALAEIVQGDILVKSWGKLGIRRDNLLCDYYEYLAGNPDALNLYRGAYMLQYDWAQATLLRMRKNQFLQQGV